MKPKGFPKPLKYLILGEPNLTKTSFVQKTGLSFFETDSLSDDEIYDISKYDLSKDVCIIGGKHIGMAFVIYKLMTEAWKDYTIIEIQFKRCS